MSYTSLFPDRLETHLDHLPCLYLTNSPLAHCSDCCIAYVIMELLQYFFIIRELKVSLVLCWESAARHDLRNLHPNVSFSLKFYHPLRSS